MVDQKREREGGMGGGRKRERERERIVTDLLVSLMQLLWSHNTPVNGVFLPSFYTSIHKSSETASGGTKVPQQISDGARTPAQIV